jgi:hypothetical protein
MSQHTPDAWIERNPDDDGRPPMSDAEMCEEGMCDHAGHCDLCEQPTGYPLEDGVCKVCDIAWISKRLLTFPITTTCRYCGEPVRVNDGHPCDEWRRRKYGLGPPSEVSILPSEEDARRRSRNFRGPLDSMSPGEIEVLKLKGML